MSLSYATFIKDKLRERFKLLTQLQGQALLLPTSGLCPLGIEICSILSDTQN